MAASPLLKRSPQNWEEEFAGVSYFQSFRRKCARWLFVGLCILFAAVLLSTTALILFTKLNDPFRSPGSLAEVVYSHAPVVLLHRKEVYFPTEVEWYARHCQLRRSDNHDILMRNITDPLAILKASYVDDKNIPIYADIRSHEKESLFYLDLLDDHGKSGNGVDQESLKDVPVYAHIVRYNHSDFFDIQYFFFYGFNGHVMSLATEPLGEHEADWEHITVRVDMRGKNVLAVFFNAHSDEGKWLKTSRSLRDVRDVGAEEDSDDQGEDFFTLTDSEGMQRTLVFAALQTHAVYPRPGRQSRFLFGAVYDDTGADGLMWHTYRNIRLLPPVFAGEPQYRYVQWGEVVSGAPSQPEATHAGPDQVKSACPYSQPHCMAVSFQATLAGLFNGRWGEPHGWGKVWKGNGPTGPAVKTYYYDGKED
mmetsp:Transcript_29491/g.74202  ORF Transcript_29491/g.74202 Transcript_29491/m.74202 type:complete len:421 (+) Transcript_29491:34-1296(+)